MANAARDVLAAITTQLVLKGVTMDASNSAGSSLNRCKAVLILAAVLAITLAGCRDPTPEPVTVAQGGGASVGDVVVPPVVGGGGGPGCFADCNTDADCTSGTTCRDVGQIGTRATPPAVLRQCWAPSCGPTGGCGTACQNSAQCDAGLACTTLPGQSGQFCYSAACSNAAARSIVAPPGRCHCGGPANAHLVCDDGTVQEYHPDCPNNYFPPGGVCGATCRNNDHCGRGLTCQPGSFSTVDGFLSRSSAQCWATSCISGGGATGAACDEDMPCGYGLRCVRGASGPPTCQPVQPAAAPSGPAPGMCGAPCEVFQICMDVGTVEGVPAQPLPANECGVWAVHPPIGFGDGPWFYRCMDANNDRICDLSPTQRCTPAAEFRCTEADGCPDDNTILCSANNAPLAGCIQGTCQQQSPGVFACGGGLVCGGVVDVVPPPDGVVPGEGSPPTEEPTSTVGEGATSEPEGADGTLCGDGVCQAGEDANWCGDCAPSGGGTTGGNPPPDKPVCGNGKVEKGEQCEKDADCKGNPSGGSCFVPGCVCGPG